MQNDCGFDPMELESDQKKLKPMPVAGGGPPPPHLFDQIYQLIKLYAEFYPRVSVAVFLSMVFFLFYVFVMSFQSPLRRNRMSEGYAALDKSYNLKALQIDHWCLFGGDDACKCQDFTEPVSKGEVHGWVATHNTNKNRIKSVKGDYDLVVYGDENVEEWNGNWLNKPIKSGKEINRYWNSTFTIDGNGQFEGLALGIAGDTTANLIWRLQHGELVNDAKVYWILAGMNDLDKDGCSEEAVTLGIVRAAEEISYHNSDSVVVIQGILPRSSNADGSLTAKSHHSHLFHRHHTPEQEAEQARHDFLLWPSIQDINRELAAFCAQNEHFVYFDADKLFLGRQQNAHYKGEMKIMRDLIPDNVHLSTKGHEVLGRAMLEEVQRIIYDDDERNDVEEANA